MKEFDNISWDEYFRSIALLSSLRSKDPHTKVGACIVSPEHKVLSLGYNGMPIGVNDYEIPWERTDKDHSLLDSKYPYVCHAELNAILNSTHELVGSTIYVTLFPCNECTKAKVMPCPNCRKAFADCGCNKQEQIYVVPIQPRCTSCGR